MGGEGVHHQLIVTAVTVVAEVAVEFLGALTIVVCVAYYSTCILRKCTQLLIDLI